MRLRRLVERCRADHILDSEGVSGELSAAVLAVLAVCADRLMVDTDLVRAAVHDALAGPGE